VNVVRVDAHVAKVAGARPNQTRFAANRADAAECRIRADMKIGAAPTRCTTGLSIQRRVVPAEAPITRYFARTITAPNSAERHP
jgi:hypothetical protein